MKDDPGQPTPLRYARKLRRRLVDYRILLTSLAAGILPAAIWSARVSYLFIIPLAIGLLGLATSFIAGDKWTERRSIATSLVIAVSGLLGPYAVIGGIVLSQPHYDFVLPAGYTGAFKVTVDPQAGVPPRRSGSKLVFDIPPGGTLRVRRFVSLFGRYRCESASYSDGSAIPESSLWRLGTVDVGSERSYWWLVGTPDDAQKTQRQSAFVLGGVVPASVPSERPP